MASTSDGSFEFVRFAVGTEPAEVARLEALRDAVGALSAAKSTSSSGQVEPATEAELEAWKEILPDLALATFSSEPRPGAWVPPSGLIEPGWDERSMLAAVLGGETQLNGVYVGDDGTAELRFVALAWPHGGITSLIRLVEAFGFDVVSYDEGSMPEVSRAEHLRWSRS